MLYGEVVPGELRDYKCKLWQLLVRRPGHGIKNRLEFKSRSIFTFGQESINGSTSPSVQCCMVESQNSNRLLRLLVSALNSTVFEEVKGILALLTGGDHWQRLVSPHRGSEMLSQSACHFNGRHHVMIVQIFSEISSWDSAGVFKLLTALTLRFEVFNMCFEPIIVSWWILISRTMSWQPSRIDSSASVGAKAMLF